MALHLFCGANYYPKGGAADYVASAAWDYGDERTLIVKLQAISDQWHDEHTHECCSGGWSQIADIDFDIIKWFTYPIVDGKTGKKTGGGWTDVDPFDWEK